MRTLVHRPRSLDSRESRVLKHEIHHFFFVVTDTWWILWPLTTDDGIDPPRFSNLLITGLLLRMTRIVKIPANCRFSRIGFWNSGLQRDGFGSPCL